MPSASSTEGDVDAVTTPALRGEAAPSPAGSIESGDLTGLDTPPRIPWPRPVQVVWFGQRQWQFMFHHQRRLGEVWQANGYVRGGVTVVSHPDHVASLFKAPPEAVPTLAAESPLRPVLGPSSVLTANEPRHLRQRKLLLPAFHGEAISRYQQMIADAAEREIARWPLGRPFALAPRMQAITLEVIMGGIFGIQQRPRPGTLEHTLRVAIRRLLRGSTLPMAKAAELMQIGHEDPIGLTKLALVVPDRLIYAIIAERRRADDLDRRTDIMSVIMRARTEEGEALTDGELRDELMTLVLAGHETTANQLTWTWERLVRHPEAHARLVEAARAGTDETDDVVEATLNEAMRVRPVIPVTGRRVGEPWRLGEYGIPADSAVAVSILLLHHREDLYPEPFAFRPERWIGSPKPRTYELIPFGGGARRCLGAALAMAEQRAVLREMARRLDMAAADPRPERPKHRNVTMIPARGGQVVLRSRR